MLVAFLKRTLIPPMPETALSEMEHNCLEDLEIQRIMAFHELD
jgi:hypothetical protein